MLLLHLNEKLQKGENSAGRKNHAKEIKYEIKEQIAVLSEGAKGWTKELNLISWNDREPKYDIREWAPDHEKMGKGVTLSKEEMIALKEAIDKL